jgi:Zn-dependent peptidase ImmA (M78 family)
MTKAEIERHAEKVLTETNTYQIPVPIDLVTDRLGLTFEAAELGANMSGMLVVENERGAIGYNASHAPVRQRFTIAHEIGHYILHLKRNRKSQFFIDPYVVFRRDDSSSSGSDKEEIEANQFAAALLMSEKLLRNEITKNQLDLDDDDAVAFLAKRFHVSNAAMTNRLIGLRFLRSS